MAIKFDTNSKGSSSHYTLLNDLVDPLTDLGEISYLASDLSLVEEIDDATVVRATGWNVQKNVAVAATGDEAADIDLALRDFVHVDVDLADQSGDIDLDVISAKRGNIALGSGDDDLYLTLTTNGSGWSNTFLIDAGAGNDEVNVNFGEAATGANDASKATVTDGRFTTVTADLGGGKDVFKDHTQASDVVYGGFGDDDIRTGAGDDVVDGGDGHDLINGGVGADHLSGGKHADRIYGDEGNDVIEGEHGVDTLYGGEGNDYILGGGGPDTLIGNEGKDFMVGGSGDDSLSGGDGSDYMVGGVGGDTFYTGGGWNKVVGGYGDDKIHLDGASSGSDTLYYGQNDSSDSVWNFDTATDVVALSGSADDVVFTQSGAHTVMTYKHTSVTFFNTDAEDFVVGDNVTTNSWYNWALNEDVQESFVEQHFLGYEIDIA